MAGGSVVGEEGAIDEDRRRTEAVRRAMASVPVSRREIARRAGVSHTTLNRIARGGKTASPDHERAVYSAIKEVREACNDAMDLLLRGPSPATRRERAGWPR